MNQPELEPTPVTLDVRFADASNLPLQHVNAVSIRFAKDELLSGPLFQVAGMFEINEPGWADKHDEYLAETYL